MTSLEMFVKERGNDKYFEIQNAQITKSEKEDGQYKVWLVLDLQIKSSDWYMPNLNVLGVNGQLKRGAIIKHPVLATLQNAESGLIVLKVTPQ